MPSMMPSEIAEIMTPLEYTRLCGKVEHKFHKAFSVISITRKDASKMEVVVELEDKTRETLNV